MRPLYWECIEWFCRLDWSENSGPLWCKDHWWWHGMSSTWDYFPEFSPVVEVNLSCKGFLLLFLTFIWHCHGLFLEPAAQVIISQHMSALCSSCMSHVLVAPSSCMLLGHACLILTEGFLCNRLQKTANVGALRRWYHRCRSEQNQGSHIANLPQSVTKPAPHRQRSGVSFRSVSLLSSSNLNRTTSLLSLRN